MCDEAHQIISEPTFRTEFGKIDKIMMSPVTKVFLTATLAIEHMDYFRRFTWLSQSSWVLRAPLLQPNVRYAVISYDSEIVPQAADLVGKLVDLFTTRILNRYNPVTQGVVFGTTVADCKAVGAKLGCMSFGGWPHRYEDEYDFAHGVKQWIAATTTLIQGMDNPRLAVALMDGCMHGLLSIVQGAGRTGRFHFPGYTFVLHDIRRQYAPAPPDDFGFEARSVEWMKNNTVCRRFDLTSIFNGQGLKCRDIPNALLCDICDPTFELNITIQDIINNLAAGTYRPPTFPTTDLVDPYVLGATRPPQSTSAPVVYLPPAVRLGRPLNLPSMNVRMNVQLYKQRMEELKRVTRVLKEMYEFFKVNCVGCWLADPGRTQPALPHREDLGNICRWTTDNRIFRDGLFTWRSNNRVNGKEQSLCFGCWMPDPKIFDTGHDSYEIAKCHTHNLLPAICWWFMSGYGAGPSDALRR